MRLKNSPVRVETVEKQKGKHYSEAEVKNPK